MKSVLLKTLLIAVCATILPMASCRGDRASDEFSLGVGLYRKARYELAAETFGGFLKQFGDHERAPLARLYYGLSLHSIESFREARAQLRRYVDENPQSRHLASARYRIAECSYYTGNYDVAIREFSEYLKQHRDHDLTQWGQLFLGESYARARRYAEAENQLRVLLDSSADPQIAPKAKFEYAWAIEKQGRTKDAIAKFQELIDSDAGILSARSMAHIGTIYFEAKEYKQAARYYDDIVESFASQPIAVSAALQSAAARYSAREFEAALTRLAFIKDDMNQANDARVLRGLCLRELGRLGDARTTLKQAFVAAGNTPEAAEILFRRAELERLDGKKNIASQMFLDLVARWPSDARAAESLFNAAESKMETLDLPTAKRLLNQLSSDYQAFAERPVVQILKGRMLLSEGKPAEAVAALRAAALSPKLRPASELLCNYHLIRALHSNEQFAEVLERFTPLEDRFLQPTASRTSQAVSLAALSCIEVENFERAADLATKYLELETEGSRRVDALAAQAVALAKLKKFDRSRPGIDELVQQHRENPQTWRAVLWAAESAWNEKDFAAASSFYILASRFEDDKEVQESGLAGYAWSRFELDDYALASLSFHGLSEKFPDSSNRSEAEYMEGFCQQKAGNTASAASTFLTLFDRLESDVRNDAGHVDTRWAFDAGRGYARIMGGDKNLADANSMYRRLTQTFQSLPKVDMVYDEWAFLNYDNEQFSRSDEIYRELVERFPNSQFTPSARLSLAESAMIDDQLDTALTEFQSLASDPKSTAEIREVSMSHAVDILAAQKKWESTLSTSRSFAEEFESSDRAPKVRLFEAEALLNSDRLNDANNVLQLLKDGVVNERIPQQAWTDRIWVLEAEVALADKRYADIDAIDAELDQRQPESRFRFQMDMVQGRRWKSQAEPDFARSREYLDRVTQNEVSRGTESAARCQFLIAETYLLQDDLKSALREYFRVYTNYAYEKWRAPALFQAALCEEQLGDRDSARNSLSDLIEEFPNSSMAARARERLNELGNGE